MPSTRVVQHQWHPSGQPENTDDSGQVLGNNRMNRMKRSIIFVTKETGVDGGTFTQHKVKRSADGSAEIVSHQRRANAGMAESLLTDQLLAQTMKARRPVQGVSGAASRQMKAKPVL
mmetsp:Transcript_30887/g.51116  ORF Transcript_30887/g.51116 Transcript_30887/m.51116 type:complete len:117 (+) Transcript_30887:520-870(+)